MRELLKTYLDMIALRKGPSAIPASWLVFYLSLLILAASWALQVALVESPGAGRRWAALAGLLLAQCFYAAVVYIFGYPARIRQTLSSIIACGSILAAVSVVEYVCMSPLVGKATAGTVSNLIWLWSVPVKGHIVAQAIQQHWFVGVTIAMAAYIMRFGVETAFVSQV